MTPHRPTTPTLARSLCLGALILGLLLPVTALAQAPEGAGAEASAEEKAAAQMKAMAEMMQQARKYTEPGPNHEFLKRFVGTWDTEMRITMPGMGGEAEKGTAVFRWLIPGRWLAGETTGMIMGNPAETFLIFGYDNFKQSFVTAQVSSLDTALTTSEGDLDPSGNALITYGTLDEYLTGEHDKMVKYLWRFLSDDEMVLEVHDLPIGEKNTQVIELRFKRASRPEPDAQPSPEGES